MGLGTESTLGVWERKDRREGSRFPCFSQGKATRLSFPAFQGNFLAWLQRQRGTGGPQPPRSRARSREELLLSFSSPRPLRSARPSSTDALALPRGLPLGEAPACTHLLRCGLVLLPLPHHAKAVKETFLILILGFCYRPGGTAGR